MIGLSFINLRSFFRHRFYKILRNLHFGCDFDHSWVLHAPLVKCNLVKDGAFLLILPKYRHLNSVRHFFYPVNHLNGVDVLDFLSLLFNLFHHLIPFLLQELNFALFVDDKPLKPLLHRDYDVAILLDANSPPRNIQEHFKVIRNYNLGFLDMRVILEYRVNGEMMDHTFAMEAVIGIL